MKYLYKSWNKIFFDGSYSQYDFMVATSAMISDHLDLINKIKSGKAPNTFSECPKDFNAYYHNDGVCETYCKLEIRDSSEMQ